MRWRKWYGMLALAVTLPFAACHSGTTVLPPPSETAETSKTGPIEIGPELYPAAPWPMSSTDDELRPDPIVIPLCQLAVLQKQDVAAEIDGFIDFIGRPLRPGEPEPTNPQDKWVHPRSKKVFKRIAENDYIDKNEVIVVLDDRQVYAEKVSLEEIARAAGSEVQAAKQLHSKATELFNIVDELYRKGSAALTEKINHEANVFKYGADLETKKSQEVKAKGDVDKINVRFEQHYISGRKLNGIVRQLYKRPGEAVKQADPILQIHGLERLRVEGAVDLQFANAVKVGEEVLIEPSIMPAPEKINYAHLQAVTSVAVSAQDKPVILSASEDRRVNIWNGVRLVQVWEHPSPVHAVVCSPAGVSKHLAVTGCADGIVRLFDLEQLSDKPIRELKEQHKSAIQALAFSPDGQFLASADEREVVLWDVDKGTAMYHLPQEHRGPITAVQFLPQARVITVSKDNAMRLWKVGQKGAELEKTIDHRSGEVAFLAAASDGSKVLFDLNKSQLQMLTLPHARPDLVLSAPSEGAKFATMALFSPDNQLILTGTSTEGLVQLWRVPTSTEPGTELRRLVTPNSVPVTCAAFSPRKDNAFVVLGTQTGAILVWRMPTNEEINRRIKGIIRYKDEHVDASGKMIKIWAEVDNTEAKLMPGNTATIVIPRKFAAGEPKP